jgi:acetylornithine deacetylase
MSKFRTIPSPGRRRLLRQGGLGLAASVLPLGSGWAALLAPDDPALAAAQARRPELLQLLSELVAMRSHSGEAADEAQQVVAGWLRDIGYSPEISRDSPSRLAAHPEYMPPNPAGDGPFVNVIGVPGERRAAPVGVFAHVDTEPVYEGWRTAPYEMTEVGGRLYGLGTADDKGGVAAMLVAASVLAEEGDPLPTVMSLHGTGGGSRGSLPTFDRFARERLELDAVLYAHPAETGRGLIDIKHEVQGALDLTLTITGWRGEPLEIGSPESAPFDTGGDALVAMQGALADLRGTVLDGQLVNVGQLEAGDRVGAVPESARARIRVLFTGDATWRELLDRAQERLGSFIGSLPTPEGRGYSATLEQSGLATNAGTVAWDSPYCKGLRDAIASVTGTEPRSYRNHYAGDIRFPIRLLGAPTFGIGSLGGNFYGPNEWVDADDLVRLVAVIVATCRRWASA